LTKFILTATMDIMENLQQQNEIKQQKDYLLPASIVIAALLIAGAWIYTAGLEANPNKKNQQAPAVKNAPSIENILAINDQDHIRGDINAPIKIVEFSDMECPFCKRFHATMQQVMSQYGNQAAWIYRHSPLEQLHPLARKAAYASECAAKLGGNGAFWQYLDKYMELDESNDAAFAQIAGNLGINLEQFNACLNSGEFKDKIDAQITDAENSGAQGTPYSVIIAKDGKKTTINGALPFEDFQDQYNRTQKGVKSLIEEALRN